MLALIGPMAHLESITIEVSYQDLGFKSFPNFSRYRNELISERLLFYKDSMYFVNPCYINYLNRRQQDYFFKLFKLKKSKPVRMLDPKLKVI